MDIIENLIRRAYECAWFMQGGATAEYLLNIPISQFIMEEKIVHKMAEDETKAMRKYQQKYVI